VSRWAGLCETKAPDEPYRTRLLGLRERDTTMLGAFMNAGDQTGLRLLALMILAAVGACNRDDAGPASLGDPADPPGTALGSVPTLASVTYTGMPYGPFGLWKMATLKWGPEPFTASHNFINADTLVLQINAARNKGQRLVVAMTGGATERYTTDGQFDMAKWQSVMNTYRNSALKKAVTAAVSDKTLIGNALIDEPETTKWGTVLTKPMIDQMAAYVKSIFPTLPVGVNHGAPGYKWRSWERYTRVDYVVYQYAHWVTNGDVVGWRDAVLAQAKLDGVMPGLSLNILNGGVQDRDGTYDCTGPGQGGLGTRYPNCWMTPDQVRSWGEALTPYACVMLMWQYDAAYMSDPANLEAFKDIAALAASKPRPSCKRP
jgi:hypothetical protein